MLSATSPAAVPADDEPRDMVDHAGPRVSARAGHTSRDMVISLLVLLIPVAIIVGLFRLNGDEDVLIVDPSAAIASAKAAGFPVVEPTGLGPDWRPIIARFQVDEAGAALRVGYLTPGGGEVQLIESTEPSDRLLARELGDQTRPTGAVDVGAVAWQSYEVRGDEHALVLLRPDHTMIAIGRAEISELRILATAVS